MTAAPSSPSTFRRHTVRWPFDRWCVITTAQNELWDSSRSISLFASMLVHACLDGEVPVVSGTVYEVARACGWMVARAAGALAASGRSQELLGAVLVLTRADSDRAGYTAPPAAPAGEPHPAWTAAWLVAEEAAGHLQAVDMVMTQFLSVDLPGRAVVLAQATAHLLRLMDLAGAHATLRAHTAGADL